MQTEEEIKELKKPREVKESHSVRLEPGLWQTALGHGINIPQLFNDALRKFSTKHRYKLMKDISYCNYCESERHTTEITYISDFYDNKYYLDDKNLCFCFSCMVDIKSAEKYDKPFNEVKVMIYFMVKQEDEESLLSNNRELNELFEGDGNLIYYKSGRGYFKLPPSSYYVEQDINLEAADGKELIREEKEEFKKKELKKAQQEEKNKQYGSVRKDIEPLVRFEENKGKVLQ